MKYLKLILVLKKKGKCCLRLRNYTKYNALLFMVWGFFLRFWGFFLVGWGFFGWLVFGFWLFLPFWSTEADLEACTNNSNQFRIWQEWHNKHICILIYLCLRLRQNYESCKVNPKEISPTIRRKWAMSIDAQHTSLCKFIWLPSVWFQDFKMREREKMCMTVPMKLQ